MLSIFLLAILVLIQIMLVSQIFNAIKIPKGVPHYHKRLVIRDLIELTFMSLVIYLLSLNYLEFMGLNIKLASYWSLLIIAVVIVGYLVTNYKTIMEGFNNNNISGYLAENYSLGRNPESIYRFNNLYPFSLDERGVSMPNNDMINVSEAEFNNNSPQKKLHVTFVNEPEL
jgi:hypothetical protein